jgi:hypothetical protein
MTLLIGRVQYALCIPTRLVGSLGVLFLNLNSGQNKWLRFLNWLGSLGLSSRFYVEGYKPVRRRYPAIKDDEA